MLIDGNGLRNLNNSLDHVVNENMKKLLTIITTERMIGNRNESLRYKLHNRK